MNANVLEVSSLEKLRQLDSCSVANAIEAFGVRLRNAGFADGTIRCLLPDFPPLVGYAATVRIRTAEPPMEGESYYYRLDWLEHVLAVPEPRVVVLEDLDERPGRGAFIGDVHMNVLQAVGCAGVVTNGAVRNLETARERNFQMFARNVSVSHAFAHIVDFGGPVVVGHMSVNPGELLHGDRHGIQTVPVGIASKIPEAAMQMAAEERQVIELCRSREFTLEKLKNEVAALGARRKARRQG